MADSVEHDLSNSFGEDSERAISFDLNKSVFVAMDAADAEQRKESRAFAESRGLRLLKRKFESLVSASIRNLVLVALFSYDGMWMELPCTLTAAARTF